MAEQLGNLRELRSNIEDYVENPTVVHRRTLDFVQRVYQDKVDYVDCSNPGILLMETSALLAAASIEHTNTALSKQYPLLATDTEDLYLHMNDQDYYNRFSTPATGTFRVLIQYETFTSVAIDDEAGLFKSVSIPMDTVVSVGDVEYTFDHEVSIQLYQNNTVRVVVTKSRGSDVPVTNNIINNRLINDPDQVTFIAFDVPLRQISKKTQYYDIPRSIAFKQKLGFKDDFYKAKIYSVGDNGEFTRLKVTHTEQITDPYDPTAVLKVLDGEVEIFIPPIYTLSGSLGSELLVILYTTQGEIDHTYTDIPIEENVVQLIDLLASPTDRADAFGQTSYRMYPTRPVRGGRHSLSFPELRERMINNNVGINRIPITPNNLGITLEDYGYTHLQYQDTVSGRTYIVGSKQPVGKELPFKEGVGISYLNVNTTLSTLRGIHGVKDNGTQVTLTNNVLYSLGESGPNFMSTAAINGIKAGTVEEQRDHMNIYGKDYRYSPFHYVVDYINGRVQLRPYQLNAPVAKENNFVNRNNTLPLFMSTGAVEINLEENGYVIKLQTRPDESLDGLDEADFFSQLSFINDAGVRTTILPRTVDKLPSKQFLAIYVLNTSLKMNANHQFEVTNGLTQGSLASTSSYMPILATIDIVYGTKRGATEYKPSTIDDIVYLPPGGSQRYPVSHEEITVVFGTFLSNLWKDSRVLAEETTYAKYTEDVPLTHEETTILIDNNQPVPFTIEEGCEVVFRNATVKDEVVTDRSGRIVYAHKKGDYILGGDGLPVPVSSDYERIAISILVYSGLFYFTTDPAVLDHIGVVSENIMYQSTAGIQPLIDMALEHTHVLYKPYDSLGLSEIVPIAGEKIWIDKPQDLVVTLSVKKAIIDSDQAKASIKETTIDTLIGLLSRRVVAYSHITTVLSHTYGDGILGVKVDGLGGLKDGQATISLVNDNDKLSLLKETFINDENQLSIRNRIRIKFEEKG